MTARPPLFTLSGMPHPRLRRTCLIVTATLLPLAGLACAAARPAGPATAARPAGSAWARLADRVPAPALHWTTCRKTAQCATAELPLNYHHPHGPTITVALLRIRAKDPRHRLGSLFVNPGGPGDSARDLAQSVQQGGVPRAILDRFDIVGVDPRGVGGSTPLRCFATRAGQIRTEAPLVPGFPVTTAQRRARIAAAEALGRACAARARSLASAMSTTDDALDLDVLRRAVGDRKLTYFGSSYGSYLGLVYANMFPGRVRAVALDGIVGPRALVGTSATAEVPILDRIGSAAASYRALHELLELCQRAGRPACAFANANTPARYGRLAARLAARPLRLAAPGAAATTFTYSSLVTDTEQWLHDPAGYRGLFAELADLARLTAAGGAGPGRAGVVRRLLRLRRTLQPGPGYDDTLEAQSAILCSDSRAAASAASWPAAAAAAGRRARYFGALYAWISAPCARSTWTAQDADVYRGPFDRRTAAPVLVVGSRWDPATSYASAVAVARLLPDSRLVSSDNWGHTALLTSACVDNAVWGYLIHPLAPAPKITHCRGDVQPFAPGARAKG
jgi:pimeloyl-ACP methyl ester carboxylesterase